MKFKHVLAIFLITIVSGSCGDEAAEHPSKTLRETVPPMLSTSVHWIDTSLNLGKIPMGDSVVFHFRFTNTGTSPLILGNIYTGCSCTTASHRGTAVAPGTTDSIKVVFDTRKSVTGFVSKTIQVKGNIASGSRVLRYSAMITGHKTVTGS